MLLTKDDEGVHAQLTELSDDELPSFDVLIDVSHSTVNYKDGMAVLGRPGIVRQYPMIPGIDVVGTVVESQSPDWAEGESVIVNGWEVGEKHWGGFSERARLRSKWLTPLPVGLSAFQSAAIGTAGYTAMLCVIALEHQGITPELGPVVVTGAAGGVGSVAIAILSKLGYDVIASTGRSETEADYLKMIGASEIIDRAELTEAGPPLGSADFAGAVDTVGSTTLASLLSRLRPDGCVAACGLAQGADLPATVLPFILRGVRLVGINCVFRPHSDRIEAWSRLATDLDQQLLNLITTTIGLEDIPNVAKRILDGQIRGRVVVDLSR